MTTLLFVLGALVYAAFAVNVLFALVLPRRPRGFERITFRVNSLVRMAFIGLSHFARRYESKDTVLAPTGPVCVVAQLATWAVGFIIGVAMMLYSTTHNFPDALRQACTSLFTVGAIHSGGPANVALDIAAGATWVIVVTLQLSLIHI